MKRAFKGVRFNGVPFNLHKFEVALLSDGLLK